jgi:hypothetical protein
MVAGNLTLSLDGQTTCCIVRRQSDPPPPLGGQATGCLSSPLAVSIERDSLQEFLAFQYKLGALLVFFDILVETRCPLSFLWRLSRNEGSRNF